MRYDPPTCSSLLDCTAAGSASCVKLAMGIVIAQKGERRVGRGESRISKQGGRAEMRASPTLGGGASPTSICLTTTLF